MDNLTTKLLEQSEKLTRDDKLRLIRMEIQTLVLKSIRDWINAVDKKKFFKENDKDIDNYAKFALDCLNLVCYKDDSQIVELSAKKVYGENPRTIIIIEELKNDTQSKGKRQGVDQRISDHGQRLEGC